MSSESGCHFGVSPGQFHASRRLLQRQRIWVIIHHFEENPRKMNSRVYIIGFTEMMGLQSPHCLSDTCVWSGPTSLSSFFLCHPSPSGLKMHHAPFHPRAFVYAVTIVRNALPLPVCWLASTYLSALRSGKPSLKPPPLTYAPDVCCHRSSKLYFKALTRFSWPIYDYLIKVCLLHCKQGFSLFCSLLCLQWPAKQYLLCAQIIFFCYCCC